jgi:hypothetical protein
MQTSSLVFALFAGFSGLRIFSYLPQIYRVACDANGASAISYATWSSWVGANLATALANLGDVLLAGVSLVYAACCATVIALTIAKRHGLARRLAAQQRHSAPRQLPANCPQLIEMPASIG